MVLKWLVVEDDENGHRSYWNYVDGVRRVSVKRLNADVGCNLDPAVVEVDFNGMAEKEVVFCYHSSYLMSDDGKTIERLN